MKHLSLIPLVLMVSLGTIGAAHAQWVYKPTKTVRSVENGVSVYRGPAQPADTAALDAALAGGTQNRTVTVRVRVDPVLRYPPRRLTTHGFVSGVRRYYRSIGPVPGRTFAPWYDAFPGGY